MNAVEDTLNVVLNEYLSRVQVLLEQIEQWCREIGLQVVREETEINEERHGVYQVPVLVLQNNVGKRVAQVVPFGESVLGAHGRVDLVGNFGKREKFAFLSEGGPSITTRQQTAPDGGFVERTRKLYHGVDAEGWYWVTPGPISRAYPVSKEVFIDLLRAVTGYDYE